LEHLLAVWMKIAEQLRDVRHILLLTDYDGTITPIVARPELANLTAEVKLLLYSLVSSVVLPWDNQWQSTARLEKIR